jgi:hypothetical protein
MNTMNQLIIEHPVAFVILAIASLCFYAFVLIILKDS